MFAAEILRKVRNGLDRVAEFFRLFHNCLDSPLYEFSRPLALCGGSTLLEAFRCNLVTAPHARLRNPFSIGAYLTIFRQAYSAVLSFGKSSLRLRSGIGASQS